MPARSAVVQLDEIPPRQCSCGTTRRGFGDESDGLTSVHPLEVSNAITRHHKIATEVYVILAGDGEVELDGVRHPARPMSAFLISANDADEYRDE